MGAVTHADSDLHLASLTPDVLATLPAGARSVVADAVVAGNATLFWAATGAAVLALVAALCVPGRRAHAGSTPCP